MEECKVGINCDDEKTPFKLGSIKASIYLAFKKINEEPDSPVKLNYDLGRSGNKVTDQQVRTGLSQVAAAFGFKYSTYFDNCVGCRFIICGAVPKKQIHNQSRQTSFYLDAQTVEKAKAIGGSNASKGIRTALDAYSLAGFNVVFTPDELTQQQVGCRKEAEAVLGGAVCDGRLNIVVSDHPNVDRYFIDEGFSLRELEAIVWWLRAGLPTMGDGTDGGEVI